MKKNTAKRKLLRKSKRRNFSLQPIFMVLVLIIIGILVSLLFGDGIRQYLAYTFKKPYVPDFGKGVYQVPISIPHPSIPPFHMPTVTLAPFDTVNCTQEGTIDMIQNVLEPDRSKPGGFNYSGALNTWEKDHYLIAYIYQRDLVSSTNPVFSIYASRCTKDYLSLGFMGGGMFTDIINPDGTLRDLSYPNSSAGFDTTQLATDLPLPDAIKSNQGLDWITVNDRFVSKPKQDQNHMNNYNDGYYVDVTIQDKTFQADSEILQTNRKADGMLYEKVYSAFGKITAITKFDIHGRMLSLEAF